MLHTCIKPACGNQYEDSDTEAYYCPSCNEARKQIAKEVDAKRLQIPRKKPMSMLDEYNAAPKGPGGFMIVKS